MYSVDFEDDPPNMEAKVRVPASFCVYWWEGMKNLPEKSLGHDVGVLLIT